MEHKINIEENKDKGFIKVTCSEGCFMTEWNKENILEYTSFRTMYCPLNKDLSNIYCVSDEDNAKYEEEKEKAIELMEKEQ